MTAPTTPPTPWHPVARADEVGDGELRPVVVGDRAIVLGRSGGVLFALARRCLHQGGDLADGIVSRGHVVCPVHGWRFSCATGALDASPETCLARFDVREHAGQIEIDPRPRYAHALPGGPP